MNYFIKMKNMPFAKFKYITIPRSSIIENAELRMENGELRIENL